MPEAAGSPRRAIPGEIGEVLRAAGCAEAREGRFGKVRTAGFRVCDSSSYTAYPVMVCTVRPDRGYGRTGKEGIAAALSDGLLLGRYSKALGQAGYRVRVFAGCAWVEDEPGEARGS